jgi:hypothetical protein
MRIVSGKDLRIATLSGAVVLLKANEPRDVSNTIGSIAMQMGAKQINDIIGVVEPTPIEIAVIEEEVDDSIIDIKLVAALERLIELGNPEDFKSDGTPKAAVVNRAIGRTVRSDERERAWEVALNS